ncbi:MAG: exodeoxyribonuclease III [Deltaproteobacteria bacterium]|nr:MAG: exodeoxyribonuclease III [Deltaproteobacteria bacterium]
MRIATWNVNSVKARLPYLLDWLATREPDVVCLQELKTPDEKFPRPELAEAGYHAYVHGQPRWNGVAVLSRQPGTMTQAGLPGAADHGARLITVTIDELSVTSVYVPNGKHLQHADFAMKLAWLSSLVDYLSDSLKGGGAVVVAGDFNVTCSDADTHDAEGLRDHIFHSAEERAAMTKLVDSGLVDLYRETNPEGGMFSWWDYRGGGFHRNLGLRIDLLMASPTILQSVQEVWTDRDFRKKRDGQTPSDHAPVIADLKD